MKTRKLIDNKDGTCSLCTTEEDTVTVTPDEVAALDEAKQREILYIENDIRVLQAKLVELQGEKAETAELVVNASNVAKVKEPKQAKPQHKGEKS